MPIIPATQEAEAKESLELGRRGCSKPRSCHCNPKKKKKRERNEMTEIILLGIFIFKGVNQRKL